MGVAHLIQGNEVTLLCSGREYFTALEAAIDAATTRVWLETYIFANDTTGRRIADALVAAAKRGVAVRVLIDGFGSHDLIGPIAKELTDGGVTLAVFRPEKNPWVFRKSRLRRMHRKLAYIDDRIAFCGGINVIDDFNMEGRDEAASYGARFDFAVRLAGAVAKNIGESMQALWDSVEDRNASRTQTARDAIAHAKRVALRQARDEAVANEQRTRSAPLRFVYRDNLRYRRRIELAYLSAIAEAKDEIFIANAYFFPGRRMMRALNAAEDRGVKVRLLLQGRREYFLQHYACRALYDRLFNSGIEVAEYMKSFLHAKVAVIDGQWATVGSSNIDPFSLLLAREANVFIRDPAFAAELKAYLERAWANDSRIVVHEHWSKRSWFFRLKSALAYRCARGLLSFLGFNQH